MKTAVGGEDKDPRKNKDWNKKDQNIPSKKEDPDYEKFKKNYKAPNGRWNGYQAPDGSWHGSPAHESAIKAHYKWSKMSPDERKKHKQSLQDRDTLNKKADKQFPHKKAGSPKTDWDHKKGYPTDQLFKKMAEQKKSVKVEPIKKKTTESVLKEKMAAKDKLKKKSPTTRARTPLPKTRKKNK